MSIFVILNFEIFSSDGTKEYFQSSEGLKRQVFIKCCEEIPFNKNKAVHLSKPLSWLAESGDYSDRTF